MKGYQIKLAILIGGSILLSGSRAFAQMDVDWTGGVGDFFDGTNWDEPFPPAAIAGEFGEINNGGTAFVNTQPTAVDPGPGGLTLGEDANESGGIEIRSGGRLDVLSEVTFGLVGNLVVGLNGEGHATVLRGGELNAVNLSSGGNAASRIILGETGGSGTATVSVEGVSDLNRTTRVIGPNVDFTTGTLRLGGEHILVPEITGATHSPLKADSAFLGGSVIAEFNGVTPGLGDTWVLVDAGTISGSVSSVSSTSEIPAGLGLFVNTVPGGMNGSVAQLSLDVQLEMTVNRRTGETAIHNRSAGGTSEIDGYAIFSDAEALNPDGWNSFADDGQADWLESNPNNRHLTELSLAGARAIGPESSIDIGSPYAFTPTGLGEGDPVVEFEYTTANGTFSGPVEFSGPHNNLVLLVDPDNGQAAIQNQSTFDVSLDGYAILSATASLNPDGWTSLEDSGQAGWFEANPTTGHLTEINLAGDTMLAGESSPISIGSPFSTGAEQDLLFEFTLSSGETLPGIVEYGPLTIMPPPDGIDGDYNNNGTVEQADLDLVLLNWGAAFDTLPPEWVNERPTEGIVAQAQLDGVLLNWGNMAAAGLGAAAGVPEPASWIVAVCAILAAWAGRFASRHTCKL